MESQEYKQIAAQTSECVELLLSMAQLRPAEILVVGCSTSEVCGAKIGTQSNDAVANALFGAIEPPCRREGIFLAVQCCEHLNRALVVERACAEKYHLEMVNVVPALKAGGALSVAALENFADPVIVENIRAHAGLDIGDTVIGMHLRPVVVPVRGAIKRIGEANVVLARTRPKYIGGPRAHYKDTP